LAACSGERVFVTDGRVVVIIDGSGVVIISVTVSVTTDWLEGTVAVGGEAEIVSIDAAVSVADKDWDAEFIELTEPPDPEPVTSPVAPAALIRD